ncbi:MAG: cytidine deaminase [Nocardioidaceae bacterium]|nr:cytidine deaminase [Nocardioidaceae bacterium]
MPTGLTDPEDVKLVTLARSTRARTGAAEGACVRDLDGRTYAGASVDLPSLKLSAVQVAVAMAVSSGARGLEAAVVLGDAAVPADSAVPADADLAVIRDLAGPTGAAVPLHLVAPDGSVVGSVTA